LDLVEADKSALRPGLTTLDLGPIRARLAEVARQTPREVLESPLNGEAIMDALGMGPGEGVGEAKRMLTEKVLDGELEPGDREGAMAVLLAWAATQPN
jgi:hypothetical protein